MENLAELITPQNTLHLRSCFEPDDLETFHQVESCVRGDLFSRFEERRKGALYQLRLTFGPDLMLCTLQDEKNIFAYLSIPPDREAFHFVRSYSKAKYNQGKCMEPFVDDEERRLIAQDGLASALNSYMWDLRRSE